MRLIIIIAILYLLELVDRLSLVQKKLSSDDNPPEVQLDELSKLTTVHFSNISPIDQNITVINLKQISASLSFMTSDIYMKDEVIMNIPMFSLSTYRRLRGVRHYTIFHRITLAAWHMLSAFTFYWMPAPSLNYIHPSQGEPLHRQCNFTCVKQTLILNQPWLCTSPDLHGIWQVEQPYFICPHSTTTSTINLGSCLLSYELSAHSLSAILFDLHFLIWSIVTGCTAGSLFTLVCLAHLLLPKPKMILVTFGTPLLCFMVSSFIFISIQFDIETNKTRQLHPFSFLSHISLHFFILSYSLFISKSIQTLNPIDIIHNHHLHNIMSFHNSLRHHPSSTLARFQQHHSDL